MFWSRFHQNYGCHGNRKRPVTYNGESDVSTPSVLIQSSSNLQVSRTGTKSWTSSKFGQIRPLPSELGAFEHLKLVFLWYEMLSKCRQWVPCGSNSSYSFPPIVLKLCRCFLNRIKMCMCMVLVYFIFFSLFLLCELKVSFLT